MSAHTSTAVLVGNPKRRSRTFQAANLVVERLTGAPADLAVDLADTGAALLDWSDSGVAELVASITAIDLVVVASPTFKSSYTGLLKLFLDRVGSGALAGTTAIPLMLGADWRHAMAADLLLKPVLVELGATCPTRGLFLLDTEYAASPALESWLDVSRPQMLATSAHR